MFFPSLRIIFLCSFFSELTHLFCWKAAALTRRCEDLSGRERCVRPIWSRPGRLPGSQVLEECPKGSVEVPGAQLAEASGSIRIASRESSEICV